MQRVAEEINGNSLVGGSGAVRYRPGQGPPLCRVANLTDEARGDKALGEGQAVLDVAGKARQGLQRTAMETATVSAPDEETAEKRKIGQDNRVLVCSACIVRSEVHKETRDRVEDDRAGVARTEILGPGPVDVVRLSRGPDEGRVRAGWVRWLRGRTVLRPDGMEPKPKYKSEVVETIGQSIEVIGVTSGRIHEVWRAG